MEAVTVLIHVLVLAVLDEGPFDLLGCLETQRDLHAVGDPPHVHLGDRRALAGMNVLGRHDDSELAVDLDDIAFTERAGDDFHGTQSLSKCLDSRCNIAISPLMGSYFRRKPRTA